MLQEMNKLLTNNYLFPYNIVLKENRRILKALGVAHLTPLQVLTYSAFSFFLGAHILSNGNTHWRRNSFFLMNSQTSENPAFHSLQC